jgi:hypothetical protein
MTIKIFLNSAREIGPRDDRGSTSIAIEQEPVPHYEGDAKGAAEALRALPVGTSVTVKHSGGQRSCMNKPDLWTWAENLS